MLDRQFAAVERTLAAAQDAQGQPFGVRVQRFLLAAGSELGRIGAAQLAAGRGGAMLRQYVEQRVDTVVYRRLDELFRDGHRQGLLPAPPELLSEITRGALERLLTLQLPRELDRTAADLLRATVDTVLYGAIRPAHSGHPGTDDEQLEAVIPTARDEGGGPMTGTTGRVVLVTGASSGIVRPPHAFWPPGGCAWWSTTSATARQPARSWPASKPPGGQAMAVQADVREAAAVENMVGQVQAAWGGVDVLVHNALIPYAVKSFQDMTWEELGGNDGEMRAAFAVTKAVLPAMTEQGWDASSTSVPASAACPGST